MYTDPAGLEDVTGTIISGAIEVHRVMGPGLLEAIYAKCLQIELRARGLAVERGRRVPLSYRGESVDHLELDLIVEGVVIVEVKAVKELAAIHQAQVLSYLKLTGCPAGLLMNFHVRYLVDGIRRLVRPDLYERPHPTRPRADPQPEPRATDNPEPPPLPEFT
jgi:GxxExxY protein